MFYVSSGVSSALLARAENVQGAGQKNRLGCPCLCDILVPYFREDYRNFQNALNPADQTESFNDPANGAYGLSSYFNPHSCMSSISSVVVISARSSASAARSSSTVFRISTHPETLSSKSTSLYAAIPLQRPACAGLVIGSSETARCSFPSAPPGGSFYGTITNKKVIVEPSSAPPLTQPAYLLSSAAHLGSSDLPGNPVKILLCFIESLILDS
jgi:hypothetical protein